MICEPCATGADFASGRLYIETEGMAFSEQLPAHLHGKCRGCDCQHQVRDPAETAELVAKAIRKHDVTTARTGG